MLYVTHFQSSKSNIQKHVSCFLEKITINIYSQYKATNPFDYKKPKQNKHCSSVIPSSFLKKLTSHFIPTLLAYKAHIHSQRLQYHIQY